jgi:hypothetical protein
MSENGRKMSENGAFLMRCDFFFFFWRFFLRNWRVGVGKGAIKRNYREFLWFYMRKMAKKAFFCIIRGRKMSENGRKMGQNAPK